MSEPKKRKSVIKKTMERLYNIAQFESIRISVSIEEEIEWVSQSERKLKTKNWTTLLLADFDATVDKVFKNQKAVEAKILHKKPGDNTYKPYTNEEIDVYKEELDLD